MTKRVKSLQEDPLPPPERKAVYVQELFERIAWRYDLMNRLMTIGRDQAWRRYTVTQALALSPATTAGGAKDGGPLVLDVATGTGDLALEVLRQGVHAQVVGLDFVPQMLVLAQQKSRAAEATLDLTAGDALHLPFPDAMFDAVVTGFALRNVTDIPAAFAEIARVTRPGGRVACLEIAKPRTPLFRHLFAVYFYRLVPIVGGWITGQRSAYTYLPHSLTAFLTPDEIIEVMRRTGWREARYRRLMVGTVAVHVGVREETGDS
jgi:demethylmenaquinone methyltransferase/2-methoxy-6-polyprenyl-1,4-benzoquinol methylase